MKVDWDMVVEWLNMCILVVLNALVCVDMVLKMLVSGVMAMEVVAVVNGRMVLLVLLVKSVVVKC